MSDAEADLGNVGAIGAEVPEVADVGVLLVHGIGDQKVGEALLRGAEAILRFLGDFGRDPREKVEVTEARLLGRDSPAHVRLDIAGRQSWLLAEAHWATTFAAPSFRDVAFWCARVTPQVAALHVLNRLVRPTINAAHDVGVFSRVAQLMGTGFQALGLVFVLMIAPLVSLALALSIVAALLPIRVLRRGLIGFQRLLVGSVGDTLAFVERPLLRAAIRTQVTDDLQWVRERSKGVLVVAHSQGAAIAVDALLALPEGRRADRLITFGGALNTVSQLRSGAARTWWASAALLLFSGSLVACLATGQMSWVACAASIVVFTVAYVLGRILDRSESVRSAGVLAELSGKEDLFFLWLFVRYGIPLGVLVGGAWFVGEFLGLGMDTAFFAVAAALLPVFLTRLARQVRYGHYRETLGSVRWTDVYSPGDPVPGGPLPTSTRGLGTNDFTSVATVNRGFVLTEHNTYWKNIDGFVHTVVGEASAVGEASGRGSLSLRQRHVNAEAWRRRRAQVLKGVRAAFIVVAALGVLALMRTAQDMPYGSELGDLFDLIVPDSSVLDFLPSDFAVRCTVIAMFTASCLLMYLVSYAAWLAWERKETAAALRRDGDSGSPETQAGSTPVVGWALVGCCLAVYVLFRVAT